MNSEIRANLIEKIALFVFAICMAFLVSCAHDPKLDNKIQKETAALPALGPESREAEAIKIIETSPFSPEQKAKLLQIATTTQDELQKYRDQNARLRLLLVKRMVTPSASDREIEGIKKRILELNTLSNKRWLSSLDEARQVIGRKSEVDARFYRAFMMETEVRSSEPAGQ